MAKKKNLRHLRKVRIRKKIRGTSDCPRLSVFRSARHITVQAIDDDSSKTIAYVSTVGGKGGFSGSVGNKVSASRVGGIIAEKLLATGVKNVVFDRNGFLYHGRVAALADGAREKGLNF